MPPSLLPSPLLALMLLLLPAAMTTRVAAAVAGSGPSGGGGPPAVVQPVRAAIAVLSPTTASAAESSGSIAGVVVFTEVLPAGATSPEVRVSVTLHGLAPNSTHGIHIHAYGDISDNIAANNTGGHFNPFKRSNHTCSTETGHAGDLGNIFADANGHATLDLTTPELSFDGTLPEFLIARSVVVHADPDDCLSMPSGKSGKRLSQGVIGWHSLDAPTDMMSPSMNMTQPHRRAPQIDDHVVMRRAAASNSTSTNTTYVDAIAVLTSLSDPTKRLGNIYFHSSSNSSGDVMVAANLTGLPPNISIGVRVLTFADIQTMDPPASAMPFENVNVCAPNTTATSDIVTFTTDANGAVSIMPSLASAMSFSTFSVMPASPMSILGHLLAIHIGAAKCSLNSTVGEFLAQGVVGLRDPDATPSFITPSQVSNSSTSPSTVPKDGKSLHNGGAILNHDGMVLVVACGVLSLFML